MKTTDLQDLLFDDSNYIIQSNDIKIFSEETVINEAFAWFRENGFPYRRTPKFICMQEINKLASLPNESLMKTNVGYRVADTYHWHRFHAAAEGMKAPVESFARDKDLRKALILRMKYVGEIPDNLFGDLTLVNGTQACSNFRPGFALLFYRRYCNPGAVVLDTSTGYGGRLVGFIASGFAGRYIGIDPNTQTHNANIKMASDLNFSDKIELYNQPAEDVDKSLLAGRCDFAFTSPPYFRKEHYSNDDTQSWKRYGTIGSWVDGFLKPMMRLQYIALKDSCYTIANIGSVKLGGKEYDLPSYMIEAGLDSGFKYIGTERFQLAYRLGSEKGDSVEEDRVASEPVIIFRK